MQRKEDIPYHITFEIVNRGCKGLRMLKESGIEQYTLSDVRGLPGGLTRHLIKAPTRDLNEMRTDTFTKIRGHSQFKGRSSAWFDSDGCDVCKAILSQNAFLISGRHVKGHTILYNFVAPNFDAFKSIMSTLETQGLKPKILEVARFKPKGILTEKQERVLWFALKMGFFAYPRKIHTAELSRKLGIAPSTLSEISRRGMRRLLEHHFET